jgi:DNA-binding protein YbaB
MGKMLESSADARTKLQMQSAADIKTKYDNRMASMTLLKNSTQSKVKVVLAGTNTIAELDLQEELPQQANSVENLRKGT